MSNQEQQFYNPERYPAQQPPPSYEMHGGVNVDPREQEQQTMYGGSEYYAGAGQKLRPNQQRPRRRGFRIFWLLPLLLIFLVGGMGYGFSRGEHRLGFVDGARLPDRVEQTYALSNPTFVITGNSAQVHIHGDTNNTNTVSVQISRNNSSKQNPIIQQSGNTIIINTNDQNYTNESVEIDITTPQTSTIQLKETNSSINIDTIIGSINAQLTDSTINADHIAGQAVFSSTNGNISIDAGNLSGTSSVHTTNGSIKYTGTLDTQGKYTFDATNGNVDVTLPENAAFHLEHSATNGRFNNEFGNDNNGSGALSTLTVGTVDGSIHIRKG